MNKNLALYNPFTSFPQGSGEGFLVLKRIKRNMIFGTLLGLIMFIGLVVGRIFNSSVEPKLFCGY